MTPDQCLSTFTPADAKTSGDALTSGVASTPGWTRSRYRRLSEPHGAHSRRSAGCSCDTPIALTDRPARRCPRSRGSGASCIVPRRCDRLRLPSLPLLCQVALFCSPTAWLEPSSRQDDHLTATSRAPGAIPGLCRVQRPGWRMSRTRPIARHAGAPSRPQANRRRTDADERCAGARRRVDR